MKFLKSFQSKKPFLALALVAILSIPATTQAAEKTPVCVLWTQTSVGSVVAVGESEVMLNKGDDITMYWFSANATAAKNNAGDSIAVTGKTIQSPTKKTTYTYTFSRGSKEVECSVVVYPIDASVKKSTLATESTKPTITGTAKDSKTVSFSVFKDGIKKPMYTSKSIKVTNGVWKHKVTDTLSKGSYTFELYGSSDLKLNTITKETLTIGSKEAQSNDSTIVVQSIPLLSGGIAKKNQTIALSYLQVLNVGLQPVTITGIKLQQTGTASTDTIVTLTAIDDTELAKGQVGKIDTPPFNDDDEALVPITLTIKPKETRLFTLKAILGTDISDDVGDTIKLAVSGVESRSSVKGTFPIKPVTWTIAK